MCCVVVEGFGEQGDGGDAPQGSRRPRGGSHRGLGHLHCDSAGPWQASAPPRLRVRAVRGLCPPPGRFISGVAHPLVVLCAVRSVVHFDAHLARQRPRGVACLALSISSPKASLEYTGGPTDRRPPALRVALHASYSGRPPHQLPLRHAGALSHEAASSVHAVRRVAEVELLQLRRLVLRCQRIVRVRARARRR